MTVNGRGHGIILLGCFIMLSVGCITPSTLVSTARWNIRPEVANTSSEAVRKALRLASKSTGELDNMMKCGTPPATKDLVGTWYGINKGLGAALLGLHQDVKVIKQCGCSTFGYNVLVEQVPIEKLGCEGWKPKRSLIDGTKKTVGNFVVSHERDLRTCKTNVVLDYNLADNSRLNPTRYLVDELIEVSPGLLLGRASIRIGVLDVQVAYFVLTRLTSEHETVCDSLCD